ncbi:hypothetical protein V8F20_011627, partial [Naviculisporaceae sp. PSN 640]
PRHATDVLRFSLNNSHRLSRQSHQPFSHHFSRPLHQLLFSQLFRRHHFISAKMPRFQQTFTVIDPPRNPIQPGVSENLPELAPAMTSKEAQRRWREKNRQPRISRVEQLRLEREEQARIKAEFEKEKAAKRAKFLREKKKEKEQKVLDEKRKKGLPLVDAHPSQSTISWFVRQGPPAKRKREETGEPGEDQQPPRPHPTQREHQQEEHENAQLAPSPKHSSHRVAAVTGSLSPMAPPPPTQRAQQASMQFFDDLDDLEDLLPSASQMERELSEEYSMPQFQATAASMVDRPPVPLFGDSNGRTSFTPELPIPLPALPTPVPARQVVDRVKTATDYFSSQDWDLSSQEVRDLDGPAQSSMGPRQSQDPLRRPEPSLPKLPLSPVAPVPASAKREASLQSSEPPRFFGSSGDGVELLMGLWESRKLARQEEQKRKEAEKKRLAEEKLREEQLQQDLEAVADDLLEPLSQCSIHNQGTQQPCNSMDRHQSELGTTDLAETNSALAAPRAESDYSASEFKGLGEVTLAQLDPVPANDSESDYNASEFKGLGDVTLAQLDSVPAKDSESDYGGSEFKGLGDVTLALLDSVPAKDTKSDYGGSEFKGIGDVTLSLLDPEPVPVTARVHVTAPAPVPASQAESFYGDSGLKELEEDALALLEQQATTAAAASLPMIIITPAGNAGNASEALGQNGKTVVDPDISSNLGDNSQLSEANELDLGERNPSVPDPNASFGVGDGSWLSDDEDLDI